MRAWEVDNKVLSVMSDVVFVLLHIPLDSALEGVSTVGSPAPPFLLALMERQHHRVRAWSIAPTFLPCCFYLFVVPAVGPASSLRSLCVQQLLHPSAPSGLERVVAILSGWPYSCPLLCR